MSDHLGKGIWKTNEHHRNIRRIHFSTEPSHYGDVIMSVMASQITSLMTVCSNVFSGADQRKHQSSASLALVWRIRRWPLNSPHKGPVTRKMFPFDDVIIRYGEHKLLCLNVPISLEHRPLSFWDVLAQVTPVAQKCVYLFALRNWYSIFITNGFLTGKVPSSVLKSYSSSHA